VAVVPPIGRLPRRVAGRPPGPGHPHVRVDGARAWRACGSGDGGVVRGVGWGFGVRWPVGCRLVLAGWRESGGSAPPGWGCLRWGGKDAAREWRWPALDITAPVAAAACPGSPVGLGARGWPTGLH